MRENYQTVWIEHQGKQFALDWLRKMEDEQLAEVYLNTPTDYDYSKPYPFLDFQFLAYEVEDFFAVAPKGTIVITANPDQFVRSNIKELERGIDF